MPLLFLIVGVLFLVPAVRGEEETKKLLALLRSDFIGPNNFLVWALAIGTVAGLGYVPKMRPLSNALLVLIFVSMILIKRDADGVNFFTSFYNQIRSTERTTQ